MNGLSGQKERKNEKFKINVIWCVFPFDYLCGNQNVIVISSL